MENNKEPMNAQAHAWQVWLESVEGQKCADGSAKAKYLENRLFLAFMAGFGAAEANESEV